MGPLHRLPRAVLRFAVLGPVRAWESLREPAATVLELPQPDGRWRDARDGAFERIEVQSWTESLVAADTDAPQSRRKVSVCSVSA